MPDADHHTDPATVWRDKFEAGRMDNLRHGFPIIDSAGALDTAITWLDKVKPEDLTEAADEIILAHAARQAVKSVARVEAAMGTRIKYGHDSIPADALVHELLTERDRAVAFYQEFRERKAKTARLEALADKARVIPFPKKAKPAQTKLRKVETA